MERVLETFVPVVRDLAAKHLATLESHKAGRKHLEDDDFLWKRLLVSMSTMGNSRGWHGLIGDESNYRQVTWDALADLNDEDRQQRLREVLRRAKVRMPDQKARWLASNYRRILRMGGLASANERFRNMTDKQEILRFLQSFDGIGPKYARNIPMDVYHPAFRNNIAVDERIKKVSEALGVSFGSYKAHETFYLRVADRAGIEGWELDRLLYNFTDEVLQRLNGTNEFSAPAVKPAQRRSSPPKEQRTNPPTSTTPPRADRNEAPDGLFGHLQMAFRRTFPDVHAYERKNGWFYGRADRVFFVAKPRSRPAGAEVRLHVARHDLPATQLELIEKPHSNRADPPVQHIIIEDVGDISEVMRLARVAHDQWGVAK